jgi:heat shock protein HtpX
MNKFPVDYGLKGRMFFTLFLLAALYLLFALVLWHAGVGLTGLILIVGIMLLAQYFFSDRLVLLSTGAKEVSREQAPELYDIVERLAAKANLPKPRIAVMPTEIPNAFATGRSPQHAVVAVTSGLMHMLDEKEVEAVLAHELTHVKSRDVAVMTMASFFATIASFIVQNFFFFGGGISGDRDRNDSTALMLVYLVSLVVWLLSFFLIRALSRYREFAADRGSAYITGDPAQLSNALMKISGIMQRVPARTQRQSEAMNAFFIIPVIKGSAIAELFSTHPSLEHRLAQLKKIEEEMRG